MLRLIDLFPRVLLRNLESIAITSRKSNLVNVLEGVTVFLSKCIFKFVVSLIVTILLYYTALIGYMPFIHTRYLFLKLSAILSYHRICYRMPVDREGLVIAWALLTSLGYYRTVNQT